MDRKEREEIKKKVETKEFLRETFDYDERGFLVWKEDRGNSVKAGSRVGSFDVREQREHIKIDGNNFFARRLIWIYHQGDIPENFVVKTMGCDRNDIRIENLELRPRRKLASKDRSLEGDHEKLRSLFSYDPVSGVLSWKMKPSRHVNIGDVVKGKQVMIQGISFLTSRICFVVHHGRPLKDGMLIDHINHDHRDNRIENLREVTPSQNAMNCRPRISKKSGLPKGVSFHRLNRKYQAQIQLNRRCQFLGHFDTPEEASAAYQEAAKRLFGEYACFDR